MKERPAPPTDSDAEPHGGPAQPKYPHRRTIVLTARPEEPSTKPDGEAESRD